MDSKLKLALKIAVAVVVPGGIILLVAAALANESKRREFLEYVRKTYGEGSTYVDTYHF